MGENDQVTLLCQPVDRMQWLGPALPGSGVRWCVQCGSRVYVSPSALRLVDSGRGQPECLDHERRPDEKVSGPSTSQRRELRSHGMSDAEISRTIRAMDAWMRRR